MGGPRATVARPPCLQQRAGPGSWVRAAITLPLLPQPDLNAFKSEDHGLSSRMAPRARLDKPETVPKSLDPQPCTATSPPGWSEQASYLSAVIVVVVVHVERYARDRPIGGRLVAPVRAPGVDCWSLIIEVYWDGTHDSVW